MTQQSLIPQEKCAAVSRALREAFNTAEIDDIQSITKGLSSDLVYRVVMQGSAFILKIMTRIDERNDPARIFASMRLASEAGLAPRIRYSSIEDGISIIEFVESLPFPPEEALARLPATLRRLHALPPFPKTFNYVTAHNGFIWRFRSANLLPFHEVQEVFGRYAELCAVYPRLDSDIVPCHDDLKPENILFDGSRVWLVDWQAAFQNDRYFDLAVVANFLVANEEDEALYLHQYFGQPPDAYQRARFFLMSQMLHLFYATVFLLLGAAGKPVDLEVGAPDFHEWNTRVWTDGIDLSDNGIRILYGRVHWERLLRNLRGPRFAEALQIVADRHRNDDNLCLLLPTAPQLPA